MPTLPTQDAFDISQPDITESIANNKRKKAFRFIVPHFLLGAFLFGFLFMGFTLM